MQHNLLTISLKTPKFIFGVFLFACICFHQVAYSDDFSDLNISVINEINNYKYSRPSVKSSSQAHSLVESIHFKIFESVKELCAFEGIIDKECIWTISIIRSPEFNAYASKGKRITLTSGLIDSLSDDDELAFIIAHEIGHHLYDHIAQNMKTSFISMVLGAVILDSTELGFIAGNIINSATSIRKELSADAIAYRIIHLAGYDTSKARQALFRIAKRDPRINSKFLQTHPSGMERIIAYDQLERLSK
jgi:Zn-dependent protease with chaperone function